MLISDVRAYFSIPNDKELLPEAWDFLARLYIEQNLVPDEDFFVIDAATDTKVKLYSKNDMKGLGADQESLSMTGGTSTDFANLEDVTLTGDTDDWDPAGWMTRAGVRVSGLSSNVELTGLKAPAQASWVSQIIFNDDTTRHIQLRHEDSGSTAENRLLLPNRSSTVTLHENTSCVVVYNPIRSRITTSSK